MRLACYVKSIRVWNERIVRPAHGINYVGVRYYNKLDCVSHFLNLRAAQINGCSTVNYQRVYFMFVHFFSQDVWNALAMICTLPDNVIVKVPGAASLRQSHIEIRSRGGAWTRRINTVCTWHVVRFYPYHLASRKCLGT